MSNAYTCVNIRQLYRQIDYLLYQTISNKPATQHISKPVKSQALCFSNGLSICHGNSTRQCPYTTGTDLSTQHIFHIELRTA